jgi:hypothetical protein
MKKLSTRWIFLVVLAFIIQISANSPEYNLLFEDKQYLTEGILQVLATDLDNDQHDDFVLAGKNDTGREIFLYWLTVNAENKPVVQWQSPNLFEEHNTLWAVSGKFTASQNQLLAITNSQYYLYQIENNHVNLIGSEKHNFQPLTVIAGDLDGDGQTEILIAKIGQITSKIYNGLVEVWKFVDGKPTLIAQSDLIGNIRGMAVGDIDQDGVAEIFVDEAPKFAAGNIHILKLRDQKLTEFYCLKKAIKGPAYGMQVKDYAGEPRLVIASANGFIDFFHWQQNALVPAAAEINLNRDLMSMAVIDVDNDKIPELLVAGYPQDFLILAPQK